MSSQLPVKKILLLSANPTEASRLRIAEKIREIKNGLRRSRKRDQLEIVIAEMVGCNEICQTILDYEPNIIHFCGHGLEMGQNTLEYQASLEQILNFNKEKREEGLVFKDQTGQVNWMDTEVLKEIFVLLADRVECVVLHACYSKVQAQVISQYIPYVIGMNQLMADEASIKFVTAFYNALGAEKSYEIAYRSGCNAIETTESLENLTPQLLRRITQPTLSVEDAAIIEPVEFPVVSHLDPELPEGQVPLRSEFYIERGTIESDCYKHITQPGSLIRIKAPRRMGKSSLMARIIDRAEEQGYRTVSLSLQSCVDKDSLHDVDKDSLHDIDKFLRQFCANVSLKLQLPSNRLNDYWDDLLPSKMRCRVYFEEYLLTKIQQPIVIFLDDVEELFQYEGLADDFFGLLRSWHEEARHKTLWQKLRLVLTYSIEVYIPLNSNLSLFNVGLPIELPEFTTEQVEDLAERYGLNWSKDEVEQLIGFVGGNPYLIRLALYQIWNNTVTLEQILNITPTSEYNIYKEHLQRLLWNLQILNSDLVEVYSQAVMADEPIEIAPSQSFKLQSLGLIRFQGNSVIPSCQLYTQYFYDYLS